MYIYGLKKYIINLSIDCNSIIKRHKSNYTSFDPRHIFKLDRALSNGTEVCIVSPNIEILTQIQSLSPVFALILGTYFRIQARRSPVVLTTNFTPRFYVRVLPTFFIYYTFIDI